MSENCERLPPKRIHTRYDSGKTVWKLRMFRRRSVYYRKSI